MKKTLLLIFLIFHGHYSKGNDDFDDKCSLQDFAPSLITEVHFGRSNISDTAKNLGSYVIYDQGKMYCIEYSDACINFSDKSDFVLKKLPKGCYVIIGGGGGFATHLIDSYMCNNVKCKKFSINFESMFDYEIGEDQSNNIFINDTFFNETIEY